jgi:hypothetical protein
MANSSRNIGLITGAVMIAISMANYSSMHSFDNAVSIVVYLTYVAGVLWAIFAYRKEAGGEVGFKQYFGEGFKCFIVVTLLMVAFTAIFIWYHPELKDQFAANKKLEFAASKDLTPMEIEDRVNGARKSYLTLSIMGAVLSYLAIGTLVSVIAAGFLSTLKPNKK